MGTAHRGVKNSIMPLTKLQQRSLTTVSHTCMKFGTHVLLSKMLALCPRMFYREFRCVATKQVKPQPTCHRKSAL